MTSLDAEKFLLLRPQYRDCLLQAVHSEPTRQVPGQSGVDDSLDGFSRFPDRNPNSCFAAVEDGALVGGILAGHDGRRGHIYHAAVRSDRRKRGIGTSLVKSVIAVFREIGIAKISLVAFRRNEAGNRFWENIGFAVRDDLIYRDLPLLDLRRYDT